MLKEAMRKEKKNEAKDLKACRYMLLLVLVMVSGWVWEEIDYAAFSV